MKKTKSDCCKQRKEGMPNHRPRLVDSLVEDKKKTEKYKALIGKYES